MTWKQKALDARNKSKRLQKGFDILFEYFDCIYEDERELVNKKLMRLGL